VEEHASDLAQCLYVEEHASGLAELPVPVVWQNCLSVDSAVPLIWQNCLYVEENCLYVEECASGVA